MAPSHRLTSRPLRLALRAARLALMVLPLVWLIPRVDLAGIGSGAARVGLLRLTLGLALQLANSVLVSWRWRILLASYASHALPSLAYLWRANLIANYVALLPVPAADEGVRIARTLSAFPRGQPSAWLVLLSERITGLVGLLLLAALPGLVADGMLAETALYGLALGSAVAFALAVPALALPSLLQRRPDLRDRVARIPLLGGVLAQLQPPQRSRDLASSVLLSMGGHFISCAVIALLFAPLDAAATLAVCVRVQPIVLLAMALPLTPVGIGQREFVFAALYGLAGVSSTNAVTVALLSFSLALAQALVGGGALALERARAMRGHSARIR